MRRFFETIFGIRRKTEHLESNTFGKDSEHISSAQHFPQILAGFKCIRIFSFVTTWMHGCECFAFLSKFSKIFHKKDQDSFLQLLRKKLPIKYLHINSKTLFTEIVDIKLKTDQKASLSTIDPNLSLSSNPSFEHNDGKLKTEFLNYRTDSYLESPIPVNSEVFVS